MMEDIVAKQRLVHGVKPCKMKNMTLPLTLGISQHSGYGDTCLHSVGSLST